MRGGLLMGLAALAMVGGAAPATAAPAAKPAAAAQDWTKVIAATPEGGFRIGNPAAPTKVIEYGSLTCGHCGHFAREGMPQLLQHYVKGGKVSFEFRNFVRDPYDLTAAMLSRCAGPREQFALTESFFAAQEQWIGRFTAMTTEQKEALNALPEAERPWRVATIGGLDAMAAKAGITPAKAKQCFADKAAMDRLVAMRAVATEQYKLQGTPTFIINGKTTEAHDWAALKPLLGPPGN